MNRRNLLKGLAALAAGSAVASLPVPVEAVTLAREVVEAEGALFPPTFEPDGFCPAHPGYVGPSSLTPLVQHGIVSQEYAMRRLGLDDEFRTFYQKAMLENARDRIVHAQFGKLAGAARSSGKTTMVWQRAVAEALEYGKEV